MLKRMLSGLLLFTLLCSPLSALGETVVTSFYPIWLFTLNLTEGTGLNVHNLAAPDTGCLHDYQLQTGDMKVLSEADLFLVNGAGMESFLDVVTSAFPDLPVREASAGIPLLAETEAVHLGEASEESDIYNAHIWLSAENAILMAENLSAALSERFPQYEELFRTNLESFTERLRILDGELKAGLSELPHRDIITFHEAFPYFAEAYGLHVVAVVNKEPGETLTPSQLASLAVEIQALGSPPLFVEPQYEDLSARTLSNETGARVFVLDPVVTGPDTDIPSNYYENVMRQNMRTLQEALSY